MEMMTERWTDGRMDDLNAKVDKLEHRMDEGFRRVDESFRRVDENFRRVDEDFRELRGEMNMRFERVEGRIDDLNRTMLKLGGGALVTFVAGFAGLIATQL
jgi:hypothetical protein